MSELPKVKGSPPSERDRSWLRHAEQEIQDSPRRLEDTTKFLVGIISIAFTIFISNRPKDIASWRANDTLLAAVVLWFAAIIFSFLVVFPWYYSFSPDAPEAIKGVYRKITFYKYVMLVLSVLLFLVALGIVVCRV